MKLGALDYKECAGDDLNVKCGLPFPRLMKVKPSETVFFSYVVFKSRAHRDRVNAKVMKDPRLASMADPNAMPGKESGKGGGPRVPASAFGESGTSGQ